MSLRYMLAVLDPEQLPTLTSPQAFVLLCLADCANDTNGICWPSLSTIGRRSRLGETATRDALHELKALGLIEVEHRPGTSSTYRLTFRNDHPLARRTPSPGEPPPPRQANPTPSPGEPPPPRQANPNLLSEPPIENTKTRARARGAVTTAPEEKPRRPLPQAGSLDEVLVAALKTGAGRDYLSIRYGVSLERLNGLIPA